MPVPPKKFNPHPFAYHEEVTFVVEDITNLGLGVGRVNSWVVMVPFVAVGETVKARIYKNNSNYSEADFVAVVTPSADRVPARCPLFTQCGGCQYQHLAYDAQLKLKEHQLTGLYERIAGVKVTVASALASPRTFNYRTKLTPHFTKVREGQEIWPIGFLRATSMGLIDVPECPIAVEAINEALPALRAATAATKAEVKRDGTLLLRDGAEGMITNPRATCVEVVNGIRYEFVAGEFFQVNRSILPLMADAVLSRLNTPYLVDAYCGGGFFALQAAKTCKAILGVELSALSIAKARTNADKNNISNVKFVEGSAESIFAQVTFPAQETTVIIDPPRNGASESFMKQLVALNPKRVIYVACDPATQARDVKILLTNGYTLSHLQPMDLFPQTRHIESLAILER